jgi:hypothetical protein
VIALAAGAAVVGVLLGVLLVQNIHAGETWDDWQSAIGGRWFNLAQYGLIALFVAGIVVRGEVGVVLIAVPLGACAVFFTVGIGRWLRRDRSAPRPAYEIDDEEPRRPAWQRVGLTVAWTVPLGAVMGVLLLDGTDEIIGMIVVVVFAGLFYEFVEPAVERWFARRM